MFRLFGAERLESRRLDADRLKRLAGWLATACILLIYIPPLLMAGFFALADADSLATSFNLPPGIIQNELHAWQRAVGSLVIEIPVLLVSLGMWEARKCFLAFSRGSIFTRSGVHSLRRFAGWLLASTIAEVLLAPVMSVLLTAGNAPGSHNLTLALGSEHLLMLPRIAMMWLLAAVIGQGREVAAPNTIVAQGRSALSEECE